MASEKGSKHRIVSGRRGAEKATRSRIWKKLGSTEVKSTKTPRHDSALQCRCQPDNSQSFRVSGFGDLSEFENLRPRLAHDSLYYCKYMIPYRYTFYRMMAEDKSHRIDSVTSRKSRGLAPLILYPTLYPGSWSRKKHLSCRGYRLLTIHLILIQVCCVLAQSCLSGWVDQVKVLTAQSKYLKLHLCKFVATCSPIERTNEAFAVRSRYKTQSNMTSSINALSAMPTFAQMPISARL